MYYVTLRCIIGYSQHSLTGDSLFNRYCCIRDRHEHDYLIICITIKERLAQRLRTHRQYIWLLFVRSIAEAISKCHVDTY